jgi:NAD+ synthase (glutamine-hydrolysing)
MPDRAPVRVALLQLNPTVGDLDGNVCLIADAARAAWARGARVALAPELGLCGYPPEDLLLRPAFLEACGRALGRLAAALADCEGLHLVVGHPWDGGSAEHGSQVDHGDDVRSKSVRVPRVFNAASALAGGRVLGTYCKRELPNYQVFDERRYFVSGRDAGLGPLVIDAGGLRLGILVCEDAWFDEPGRLAAAAGAQALCVINASPFHLGKPAEREALMARCARANARPLLYAHMVGGQDEMVFDGGSFALDADGAVVARAPLFETATLEVDLRPGAAPASEVAAAPGSGVAPLPGLHAQAWAALVLGVRDYVGKNGFPGAIIGLSGGVDSALVLAVAVDALGAGRVRAVMMPSAYTADISWIDAREMAARLGVRYDEIPIAPMVDAFGGALAGQFAGLPEDATEENIQARARGTLLMALSNKTGAIVLTTGNKSEMATGYCTLYGDMAGGFAVIKDVAKTLVYALAHWKNRQPSPRADGTSGPVIPERILTRAPSAELRPGQTDQDSLPPYEALDAILAAYMEQDQAIEDIVAAGFARADVERVTRLIKANEHKRRQAPIGIRITNRAFGRDWRYPITSRFRA